MPALLIGFDSAWTIDRAGALVGVLRRDDGGVVDLGPPIEADFAKARATIEAWQAEHRPAPTLVLIDQPTIVRNPRGQRPVENLVSPSVSKRYGGVQPANTEAKAKMFGPDAPVWGFLEAYGGAGDPFDPDLLAPQARTLVLETYPVLSLIALGWTLSDKRPAGRLPKYNPDNRSKFLHADWEHVCREAGAAMKALGALHLQRWLQSAELLDEPTKADQDQVDACLCLLVALHIAAGKPRLVAGDMASGCIVVPHGDVLESELRARCEAIERDAARWVRVV